jgi:hypothetical protein
MLCPLAPYILHVKLVGRMIHWESVLAAETVVQYSLSHILHV